MPPPYFVRKVRLIWWWTFSFFTSCVGFLALSLLFDWAP
uniref:Uncharacterized protein n=1 Tax=Arundo donax TaxID=35708 RepID=A0A0A8XZ95_ARUDO